MKAEELMIGDWVRCTDHKPFRIIAIDTRDNLVVGDDGFEVDIADLQPIPLTPEILEKNFERVRHDRGIEGRDYHDWDYYMNDEYYVVVDFCTDNPEDSSFLLCDNDLDGSECFGVVEYVHELQHIAKSLRCLLFDEIDIKL